MARRLIKSMESFGKVLVLTLWLVSQCLGFAHSNFPNVTGKDASALLALERHQTVNYQFNPRDERACKKPLN
jgi:hypothetical protein